LVFNFSTKGVLYSISVLYVRYKFEKNGTYLC
jgi:hypothetical protein